MAELKSLHLSNEAPEDADPFIERLAEDHAELADQASDLEIEALLLPLKIDTDEQSVLVTEFVAKAKAVTRRAEKSRVEAKEPHLERGRKVDGFFKDLTKSVSIRISRLEQDLNDHAKAKAARERAERLAREQAERAEAERQRQEAETARRAAEELQRAAEEAAAKIRSAADAEEREAAETAMREAEQARSEQARVAEAAGKEAAKSDRVADAHQRAAAKPDGKLSKTTASGGSTSTTTFWTHEITDEGKLIASLGELGPHLSRDAITAAIGVARRAAVAAETIDTLSIPGVRFFQDQKTNVLLAKPK